VPLIGLVQMGLQPALADRYAYVSFIGLFIMVAWGIPELLKGWRSSKTGLAIIAIALLLILMMTTWLQLNYWANSVTLFKRAVDVTSNNYIAHDNLGLGLIRQGRLDEAYLHFSEAIRIKPNFSKAYHNIGAYLLLKGKLDEAIYHFKKSLQINPYSERVYNNLGRAMIKKGKVDKAIEYYQKAIRIKSNYKSAQRNLKEAMVIQENKNCN